MRYSQHSYRKPGVFIERADASRVPPVVLRTDIAAFVGMAEQGPLDTPVPVESVRQFTAHFGDFIGGGYLAYVVRAFFENGGRRCWVVRVAQRDFDADGPAANGARPAWVDIADADGNPALRMSASSAGSWGNGLALEWSASGAVLATSVPGRSTPQYATLRSVAGLAADELVRIEQAGAPPQFRVIAAVDVMASKVYWVHPDPVRPRTTDEKLFAFDPLLPLRIVRIAYALTVRRDGLVIGQHGDLHLAPAHPRFIGNVLRPTVYWAGLLQGSALVTDAEADAARDGEPSAPLPRAPGPCIAESLATAQIPRPLDVPFDRALALAGGQDGLTALTADDFIGEPVAPEDEYSASDAVGIRSAPYTNYPRTYGNVAGTGVHFDGEVYAAIGWKLRELYLANGLTTDQLLRDMVQGMRFTPAQPKYEQMRDGILSATTTNDCLVWTAFAQYGVGQGASATVSGTTVTVNQSFTIPTGVCP